MSDINIWQEKAEIYKRRVTQLRAVWEVQASHGNWNSSEGGHAMFRGLELAMAIMEGREVDYRDRPEAGYLSETHPYPPAPIMDAEEQAPSVHKNLTPEQVEFVSKLQEAGSGGVVMMRDQPGNIVVMDLSGDPEKA